jgi:uncharacterized NAD(P)/FAD-binding protein YdhS
MDQPDYLLLNTVCSHISMFPEVHSVGDDVDEPGPSLYDWVTQRGFRLAADGFTVGREGRPIEVGDFLPRRLLGEYLAWFLHRVLNRAPGWVSVNLHRSTAIDFQSQADAQLAVVTEGGEVITTQYAFVTTGHTSNSRGSGSLGSVRIITDPYPLPGTLEEIGPGQSVAINGFGLAAMDVIAACTVGRGGRFEKHQDSMSYVPGGREPELYLYSRSGVPFRARPHLHRLRPRYQPIVLTSHRIDLVRHARGGLLDFDRDVLPLLLAEMCIAYYRHRSALTEGEEAAETLADQLRRAAEAGESSILLDELDGRYGPFDVKAVWDRAAGIVVMDSLHYRQWIGAEIRRDLVEAAKGLEGSCEKAAVEIVRELRDTIRYAVDFGGLTDASLDSFMGKTVPLMNKAVVGPQKERHEELLALIESGIVQVPFGPSPRTTWDARGTKWSVTSTHLGTRFTRQVDWICYAHTASPKVSSSASPLIERLYGNGWLRRHRPNSIEVYSVDLDSNRHPVAADGQPDRRLWVLGPLCEGTTFYNHLVPSPGGYSRVVADAHRTVAEMFVNGVKEE